MQVLSVMVKSNSLRLNRPLHLQSAKGYYSAARFKVKSRRIDTIKKAAVLSLGALMLIAIVMLASPWVQSRFVEASIDNAPIFIDKYVDKNLRAHIVQDIGKATQGFLLEAGLLEAKPVKGPVAYFITDRHYGVISAHDPLVKMRIQNRPSSDFILFRSISTNYYANEPVTKSVTAQDGSYVFINADDQWRGSVLHAYAHAIAATNAPASVALIFRNDGSFDPAVRFAFRFIDETFALLASDMYILSLRLGSNLEESWAAFPVATAHRYTDPDSDILKRESEILIATYDMPQKSAEFYSSCNAFAAWMLQTYGRQMLCTTSAAFFTGNYETLDQLFGSMGGFNTALEAWKGNTTVPF